ncbi:uncharacterized protein LOC142182082 [Nicotiana tabacum]|uniref:Uncharacterized protein LOC142182082 n=1 Tax=Nicotiana tabacum TaxID=4097 RepID=A0AC58URK0_TOBAC
MSNLSKLEFVALDISGKNYLSWVLDAEIHLVIKYFGNTITQGNEASSQDKAKAMIFFRHHLDEGLKVEYLTVKVPLELWNGLKEMYDHLKATVLPRARYEWMHLRLQDFKTLSEYNSVVFQITSQLKLCGDDINDEDLLEKTITMPQIWLYQNSIKRKVNNAGASSANAPVESHLTFRNDFEAGPSNKNDDNAEANHALNDDDDFQGLDDLTHLEVE